MSGFPRAPGSPQRGGAGKDSLDGIGDIHYLIGAHPRATGTFVLFRAAPAAYGRLGVESEPQPQAYATTTATRDRSLVCHLHHSSWQRWILNPPSKARD